MGIVLTGTGIPTALFVVDAAQVIALVVVVVVVAALIVLIDAALWVSRPASSILQVI